MLWFQGRGGGHANGPPMAHRRLSGLAKGETRRVPEGSRVGA